MTQHFSHRHGYAGTEPQQLIREDAPNSLREAIYAMSRDYIGSHVVLLNRIYLLSGQHWRDKQSVSDGVAAGLVRGFLNRCAWFQVYDTIEIMQELIQESGLIGHTIRFEEEVNEYLIVKDIGWQLVDSRIEYRGDGDFEALKAGAIAALEDAGLEVALDELSKSVKALSERPVADLTGAMTHARACVDSVVREVTGSSAKRFSKTVKSNPKLFPTPLGDALIKVFAYVGDEASHPKEGRTMTPNQAQFVVEVSAAAAKLLVREYRSTDQDPTP